MTTPQNELTRTGALVEVGISGLRRWGGMVREEFLAELQGTRGAQTYDEMRKNDAVIGSVLRATKDTIRAVKWTPEGGDEKDVEFLQQCMEDMSHSWNDLMSDVTTVLPFGFAPFEVTYKIRAGEDAEPPSQHNDGLISWRKVGLRSQRTLSRWEFDDSGGIQGMWQQAWPDFKARFIPIWKMVLFRTEHEANNPEGMSLLRNCYRPWYFKKNLEEVEAIGIERDLTGIPVFTLPEGATTTDRTKAESLLERIKNDELSGIVEPRGQGERQDWKFRLESSPGQKSISTDEVIQRYSGEIATAFLAQFLRLGQQRVGSYALSRSQRDFFYQAVAGLADNIEETVNRFLLPPLWRLNGRKSAEMPKLRHGAIAPRDLEPIMKALQILFDTGLLGRVDDNFVNFLRREMEFPEQAEEGDSQFGWMPLSEDDVRLWSSNGHSKEPVPATKKRSRLVRYNEAGRLAGWEDIEEEQS